MKVYFSAPIKSIEEIEDSLKTMFNQITKLGHKHLDNYLQRLSEGMNFYDKMDKGGTKIRKDYFDKTVENIKSADAVVFECTVPSLGIGFQIEKALDYNKPTIVLYTKNHMPNFLAGTENDKLILKEYSASNVVEVITEALEEAKHSSDKRFNFFISPLLLTYLQEESEKSGMTKSAFIRKLILEYKKRSKK